MKYTFARLVMVAALFVSMSAGFAHAETVTSCMDGGLLDDPEMTASAASEMDGITELKEASLGILPTGDSILSLNRYGLQTRPVTNFRQDKSYYCGPAAARQALSFHRTASRSSTTLPCQTVLATQIGTETNRASSTAAIARALNSYKGTFGSNFNYIASDIAATRNPFEAFVNRIGTQLRSITQNPTTPIILCQTNRIPRYRGVASRHYMTISGIDDNVRPIQMRSVDPHYLASYYGIRWETVGSTTTNGLFRAVYQADCDGTNKVMAW